MNTHSGPESQTIGPISMDFTDCTTYAHVNTPRIDQKYGELGWDVGKRSLWLHEILISVSQRRHRGI